MNSPTPERSLEGWARLANALRIRIEDLEQEQAADAAEYDWLFVRGDELINQVEDRQQLLRVLRERLMKIEAILAVAGRDAA